MARYGAVYIAHNPWDGEDVFKIGWTNREVGYRIRELTSDTTNLGTYQEIGHVVVRDGEAAEKACHKRLGTQRLQKNKEFFKGNRDDLVAAVRNACEPYAIEEHLPPPGTGKPDPGLDVDRIMEDTRRAKAQEEEKADKKLENAKAEFFEAFRLLRDALTELCEKVGSEDSGMRFNLPSKKLPSSYDPITSEHGVHIQSFVLWAPIEQYWKGEKWLDVLRLHADGSLERDWHLTLREDNGNYGMFDLNLLPLWKETDYQTRVSISVKDIGFRPYKFFIDDFENPEIQLKTQKYLKQTDWILQEKDGTKTKLSFEEKWSLYRTHAWNHNWSDSSKPEMFRDEWSWRDPDSANKWRDPGSVYTTVIDVNKAIEVFVQLVTLNTLNRPKSIWRGLATKLYRGKEEKEFVWNKENCELDVSPLEPYLSGRQKLQMRQWKK